MRADRLVAITLLLQTHGQLTAGDLAERLETSERTIRRDLDSLSGAGVPVYAQRGRGGGWALLGGHRIDLTGLTAEEAQALFLVTDPRSTNGLGVAPGAESALRKILAALPAPLREQVAAARSAVLVDPVAWGGRRQVTPHLDTLRDAVVRGVQVDLDYAKPGEEAARRRVHPYGLVSKAGTWYLMAGTPAGQRTFRLSRMASVTETAQPVERPAAFDLAQAWAVVETEVPRRRAPLGVRMRVCSDHVARVNAALRSLTGGELDEEGEVDGWRQATGWFPTSPVAAGLLARFGASVEVLDPPEVRHILGRLGAELSQVYGVGGGMPSR